VFLNESFVTQSSRIDASPINRRQIQGASSIRVYSDVDSHNMPIIQSDTTKIATRFEFTCSIRFNLKDKSDYEKTVHKQSREKITLKNQYSRFVKTRIIGISLNSRI